MRALFIFLLFCVYALAARWFYVCQVKQMCAEVPGVPADQRPATLKLFDAADSVVLLSGYDQFAFDPNSISPRLNDDNRAFLDTLAGILQQRPDRHLTVTAFYRENEADLKPGFYENMGIARAADIRSLLMRRGIAEGRISLDHGLSEDSFLLEPLLFELYIPSGQPEAYEKVQFTFTNMTFMESCFAFDSDEFRPGEPFILYADSVKTYLDEHPDRKLTIVGHTDNIGTEQYNYDLGMRRADSAREYFRELGVTTRMDIDSKGEKIPVASNRLRTGRQKNRRVNIIIEPKNE